MKKLHSQGNNKTGNIPSFNLPPVITCGPYCKFCKDWCYANRAYSFKGARKMYEENMKKSQKRDFSAKIIDELSNFRFVRIHVSGDFYSTEYAKKWMWIARNLSETKFLAFTKQYEIWDELIPPKNLKIIYSTTPNMPRAMKDDIEYRAYKGGYATSSIEEKLGVINGKGYDKVNTICKGKCSECHKCWKTCREDNIVLKWHGNFANIGFKWTEEGELKKEKKI